MISSGLECGKMRKYKVFTTFATLLSITTTIRRCISMSVSLIDSYAEQNLSNLIENQEHLCSFYYQSVT